VGNQLPDRLPVIYRCHRCGGRFIVWQGDGEPDEDISLCWGCIDELLPPRSGPGLGLRTAGDDRARVRGTWFDSRKPH
jgi:hypothetical protein